MLIFYLDRNPKSRRCKSEHQGRSSDSSLLTTPSQVCEPSGFKLQFCSDRQSQDLQQQVLLPGLHGIPFSFLNSMSTVFGNLNATKV